MGVFFDKKIENTLHYTHTLKDFFVKKMLFIFSLIVLVIGIAFVLSSEQQDRKRLPADLKNALVMMEAIESRALDTPVTDKELAFLTRVHDDVQVRIPKIRADKEHFQLEVVRILEELFPGNPDTQEAASIFEKPGLFVIDPEEFRTKTEEKLVQALHISSITDEQLDQIVEAGQVLKSDQQWLIQAGRFNTWFSLFQRGLCLRDHDRDHSPFVA